VNQELALGTLSKIMGWPDDQARREFAWLRLMARVKYDGYSDFLAGVRFLESLAKWLQQFDAAERPTAYNFVRSRLVYVGPPEMERLVEAFFPKTVRNHLLEQVASQLSIPKYRVWSDAAGPHAYRRLRRKTLYMGLSDGARLDILRHSNTGAISNEQVVLTTQLDLDKWQDLLASLRKELSDPAARFASVYLIDDFMGTGTSFLRFSEEKKAWKGKLMRFRDSVQRATAELGDQRPFEDGWELRAHHYLASHKAVMDVGQRVKDVEELLKSEISCASVVLSFGSILPKAFPIDVSGSGDFVALTNKYYDPSLRNEHTDVGGVTHLGLGYGGCALPLVLSHNTPNNAVALLWAETNGGVSEDGESIPAMRPLFRRRQRHG
jgi:hypothetical protein